MNLLSLKKAHSFNVSLGRRGEMIGGAYLSQKGFDILEKNYRCPLGEVDVIARKNGRIFFIEIKTRSQSYFGPPEESVHLAKQRKIVQVAQWYLKERKMWDVPMSFGVLAIEWKSKKDPQIRLIENAFTADSPLA